MNAKDVRFIVHGNGKCGASRPNRRPSRGVWREQPLAAASSRNARRRHGLLMPAYAKDGKVVCFFQSAQKFKTRYATFGFSEAANLDEGTLWPVAFAVKELTAADEARIGVLVKEAVS